jgi:tRNA-splicing ligase RtcB
MKPHKIYADPATLDGKALSQFYDALKQPWAVSGALMPDAHVGYTLPIGGVIATDGVIVPAFVGYDIGCGVCAIRTEASVDDVKGKAQALFDGIYDRVPCGVGQGHTSRSLLNLVGMADLPRTELADEVWVRRKAEAQMGTLGSGNHFLEVGYDEESRVWVIIHSGSRGFGHGLAEAYMKIASGSSKAKEGFYALETSSQLGRDYIQDMNFALEYALSNRFLMLDLVENIFQSTIGAGFIWDSVINRNHNHAVFEHGLWIHRKGATHAEHGMLGVIPGNMRDGSFIVCGTGEPEALWSSSHGAGRVMGRAQANRELNLEDFAMTMSGVVAKVDESTLDEAPMAYKNIFDVMEMQKDLVKVVHHIRPLINVKG